MSLKEIRSKPIEKVTDKEMEKLMRRKDTLQRAQKKYYLKKNP